MHQDGRRLTLQRKRVLELFERRGSGCHLSAEEVHQQLVDLKLKVSLATVYRTLRLLADMDFLQELELSEGGRRFELSVDDHRKHHHVVCIRCGLTEEFENDRVLEAGAEAAREFGFKLIESSLNVRAICSDCQT
ncbi:transcriptional repressor [Synechococcus sp. M16CYN]